MSYNILFAEDEKKMHEIINDYFSIKDCKITFAENGREALELFEKKKFDLILLDIMMPGLDGFSVCKKIRKNITFKGINKNDIPIIFITAKSDEEDHLIGYELGADDYITKPFSLNVLYAKCISVIKRSRGIIAEEKLYANKICMNINDHKVFVNNEQINIPPLEYKILKYFIENKNRIIEREQLIVKFWGYDFDGNDRVLDTHIKKLRKCLKDAAIYIHTIPKIGYRFEVE